MDKTEVKNSLCNYLYKTYYINPKSYNDAAKDKVFKYSHSEYGITENELELILEELNAEKRILYPVSVAKRITPGQIDSENYLYKNIIGLIIPKKY